MYAMIKSTWPSERFFLCEFCRDNIPHFHHHLSPFKQLYKGTVRELSVIAVNGLALTDMLLSLLPQGLWGSKADCVAWKTQVASYSSKKAFHVSLVLKHMDIFAPGKD